mmetsp:Transcript_42077/g.80482  ORF Transcript_42077/g.80482 Transcript_42077/m.80482 type:complete len:245 (-) Transcript_42077:234-968(-)
MSATWTACAPPPGPGPTHLPRPPPRGLPPPPRPLSSSNASSSERPPLVQSGEPRCPAWRFEHSGTRVRPGFPEAAPRPHCCRCLNLSQSRYYAAGASCWCRSLAELRRLGPLPRPSSTPPRSRPRGCSLARRRATAAAAAADCGSRRSPPKERWEAASLGRWASCQLGRRRRLRTASWADSTRSWWEAGTASWGAGHPARRTEAACECCTRERLAWGGEGRPRRRARAAPRPRGGLACPAGEEA